MQPGRMWYGGKWSSWCSHGSSGGGDAIWRRDAMDQRHSRWRSNCQNGTPSGGGDGQICRRPTELPKCDTRFQEKDKKRRIYVCDWCRCIVQFGTRASGFEGRFVDDSWRDGMRYDQLYSAWQRGEIDATWWCLGCHAEYWMGFAELGVPKMRNQLGLEEPMWRRMTRAENWRWQHWRSQHWRQSCQRLSQHWRSQHWRSQH